MAGKKSVSIGTLSKGSYIMVDDVACRVQSMQVSRPGKHGHAKSRIICIGLFDKNKRSLTFPSHTSVDVPLMEKNTALVSALMGDQVMLTDNETFASFEMDLPKDEELLAKIVEGATVEYWDVMNRKIIVNIKGTK